MSPADDGARSPGPLDALRADPAHHHVLLENEHVRVLDTRVRPGEQTQVHTHVWPATLYVLSWSDFVRYDPEGRVLLDARELPAKPAPGAALWGDPLPPHFLHNVGDRDLHIIAVELKPAR